MEGHKKVVILGASFASLGFCLSVPKNTFDITIIDPKGFLEFTPLIMRSYTLPEMTRVLDIPFNLLEHFDLRKGKAVNVTEDDEVVLESGETIPFDYLVVASGTLYPTHPWTSNLYNIDVDVELPEPSEEENGDDKFKVFTKLAGVKIDYPFFKIFMEEKSTARKLFKLYAKKKTPERKAKFIEYAIKKGFGVDAENSGYKHAKRALKDLISRFVHSGTMKDQHIETIEERVQSMRRQAKLTRDAQHIVIAGSGYVALELIGEILSVYKDKRITLILTRRRILDSMESNRARAFIESKFQPNVEIIYNERVSSSGPGYVALSSGRVVTGDKIFLCTGNVPNSGMLKERFPNSLDERGFIKVHLNLLVEGTNNIFAIGAVSNLECDYAGLARQQGMHLASNLVKYSKSNAVKSMKSYSPTKSLYSGLLSIGPHDSVFIVSNWCISAGTTLSNLKWKSEKWKLKFMGQDKEALSYEWKDELESVLAEIKSVESIE